MQRVVEFIVMAFIQCDGVGAGLTKAVEFYFSVIVINTRRGVLPDIMGEV